MKKGLAKFAHESHGDDIVIQPAAFLVAALVLADAADQVNTDKKPVGVIESCNFKTTSLAPPFHPPKAFADGYKLFQAGGSFVSEGLIVKSVILLGNSQLRLKAEETKQLYANLDDVYASISEDELFKNIDSALPYCLADKRPSQGHYFAYYPNKITDETRTIVFLHGYGGNLLFYTYLLKEEFPDAIILLPSWGASWYDGTMQYLDDMIQDVKQRRNVSVRTPCLMAISAGGPTGFRLYNERSDGFACYISIASAPSKKIIPVLKKDLKILMVNGEKDSGFRIAGVKKIASHFSEQMPQFQIHVIDSDHFFLLSKRDETFRVIKAFLHKETGWNN